MRLWHPGAGWTAQLLALVVAANFAPATLLAQPRPGSITTRSLPVAGPTIIDAAGNTYMMASSGPVTTGAAQTQPGGGLCLTSNGFFDFLGPCPYVSLTKADSSGNVVFGTLLGGQTADTGTAFAVDSVGSIYVTGSTGGSFPTTPNAAIPVSTSSQAFVAKLSPDGSTFVYATYLPSGVALTSGIAVDAQGNAYVVGKTTANHAFVTKLSADGSTFPYANTLAGANQESGLAIAVDAAGNAIVAGQTSSTNFPVTTGVVQSKLAGAQNVFVTKLDASGNLAFSTYLGGSGSDTPNAVQMDAGGNIYVAGATTSLDFPTTPGSFEPVAMVPMWNLSPGGFVAKLNPNLSALGYSSYVTSLDRGPNLGVTSLALSASGDTYVTGATGAGFPVTESGPQPCFGGATDVFVAHLDSQGALRDATYIGDLYSNAADGLAVAGDGSVLLAWHGAGAGLTLSQIVFGAPGWVPPACMSPDTLNAATLFGTGPAGPELTSPIAPGEFLTLTGFGIGPQSGVAYQPDAQGNAPLALSGVQVFFDGQAAPLLYVQSQQVNLLAPFELSGKTSTAITLQYNQATFGPVTVPVQFGEPGIFRLQPGASSQAAALNQDGTVNGPSNPASPGSVVTLWGTGFGPTDPACATGGLNQPSATNLAAGLSAELFNGSIFPAQYAGSAPTLLCGVVQINLVVPSGLPPGPFQFAPWAVMSMADGGGSTTITTIEGGVQTTIAVK
jgi:uncharacterized protein (TIGR03437 family)